MKALRRGHSGTIHTNWPDSDSAHYAPAPPRHLPLSRGTTSTTRIPFSLVMGLFSTALLVSLTLAVMIGPVAISPGNVWGVALDRIAPGRLTPTWEPFEADIVWEIRFPRSLLGAVVGAGLAVVGGTMQALVRNPLADPYLLGVSSGAAIGAVSVMLLGVTWLGMYSISAAAFLGAMVTCAVVVLLAQRGGQFVSERLILAGVAVSYVLSAGTSFLVFNAENDNQVRSVLFWLLGGLGGARWDYLLLPALALGIGIVVLALHARSLNVLLVGEETAVSLGVDPSRFRRGLFVLTSLLTGVMVAVSGGIGFVGLMMPHIVRQVVGSDYRRVLPAAALAGAVFLLWADVLARTIVAPEELPIGIITALCGGPFFVALMLRRDRERTAG